MKLLRVVQLRCCHKDKVTECTILTMTHLQDGEEASQGRALVITIFFLHLICIFFILSMFFPFHYIFLLIISV